MQIWPATSPETAHKALDWSMAFKWHTLALAHAHSSFDELTT